MKMSSIATISTLSMVTALILTSCGPAPKTGRIVEFSCDQEIVLMNYANYEASTPGTDGKFAVYVAGPSLFFLKAEGECESIYLYLPEDGNHIDLHVEGDLLYANGIARTIAVKADKPRNFAEWYASADETALKSLRIIEFDGAFEKELKAIQLVNPHFFGCFNSEQEEPGEETFSSLKPLFFMAGSTPTNNPRHLQAIERADLSECKILMLAEVDPETLEALAHKAMPNLYRLILPAVSEVDKLLDAFPHVKAVTFIEGDNSIPDLGKLRNVEEMHIRCDTTMGIVLTQLQNPAALRILSLPATDKVVGMERLINLEYLNPGKEKISDEHLATLISAHPNLVFLNLVYATLESLEPLRKATHLEGIALGEFSDDSSPDFTPLGSLKNLRYIGLPDKLAKEEVGSKIQDVCPKAVIYQHDKFCLGSGWLVSFLPILLILLFVKRCRTRKGVF